MLELGVLADDLTGGMMVASLLEREGVRCPLVTSAEALKDLDESGIIRIGAEVREVSGKDGGGDDDLVGHAFFSKRAAKKPSQWWRWG